MAQKRDIDPKLSKVLDKISGNLERLRLDRGWSQLTTAEKLETDLRWYQRLESGKHALSLSTLVRLASLFKVDLIEFFK